MCFFYLLTIRDYCTTVYIQNPNLKSVSIVWLHNNAHQNTQALCLFSHYSICYTYVLRGFKSVYIISWSVFTTSQAHPFIFAFVSLLRCVPKQEEAYTLFFGNNNWYLFLRLHAILCSRLRGMCDRAQLLLADENNHRSNRRESTATALRLKPKTEIAVEDYYPTFLDMLKNVLDGNMEATSYEDALREMFGIHAYTAFTLDRVSA